MKHVFVLSFFLLMLNGCASNNTIKHVPVKTERKRDLIVFFDGTANDETSRTNVAKLHNLVSLHDSSNISTLYVAGVGTNTTGKLLGLGTGFGVGRRVREAYQYLVENYDPDTKDEISIVGFSRGAWSARMLASMLYVSGLPDMDHLTTKERESRIEDIYNNYKSFWSTFIGDSRSLTERREDVQRYLDESAKKDKRPRSDVKPVTIKFLGLWDTIEALGIILNREQNVGEPNPRYADQICNIKNISHAVSLDDNRARLFTPLLFMQKHLLKEKCVKDDVVVIPKKINEVWFSGAHSDVGGGYQDTNIGGISLNWMIKEMSEAGFKFLENKQVYANHLDKTHDPDSGFVGLIYGKYSRKLDDYYCSSDYINPALYRAESIKTVPENSCDNDSRTLIPKPKIKLHPSVIDRLCVKAPETYESLWFRDEIFVGCLLCDGEDGKWSDSDECKKVVEIEDDKSYKRGNLTAGNNFCGTFDSSIDTCYTDGNSSSAEHLSKSCNLYPEQVRAQAKQRLKTVKLHDTADSPVIITYFSDREDDNTGVFLKAGVNYKVTKLEVSDWYDCGLKSHIQGRKIWARSNGEKNPLKEFGVKLGSSLLKPFSNSLFKGYSALLAYVSGQRIYLGDLVESGDVFQVENDGELILTVNEPIFSDFFYNNNFGYITFTIEVD